jgi:hypothetical protein
MKRKKQPSKKIIDLIMDTARKMNLSHVVKNNRDSILISIRKKLDEDLFGEDPIIETIQDSILEFSS